MNYLDLEDAIKVFLEVAERAGREADAIHPEDIAIAMTFAIEHAANTLAILGKHELI